MDLLHHGEQGVALPDEVDAVAGDQREVGARGALDTFASVGNDFDSTLRLSAEVASALASSLQRTCIDWTSFRGGSTTRFSPSAKAPSELG